MAIQQAGGTFIAVTGHGLTRAVGGPDGGWAVESVLANQKVRCLAAAPHNPRVIYAGTRGSGVLRSSDAGATWQPRGLAGRTVTALAASTDGPGTLYAGTKPPCIFVSGDDGVTWTESAAFRRVHGRRLWFSPAERPFTAYVQAIAIAPDDPEVVLVGIEAGAVLRTADGGQTWSGHRRGALRDCHTLIYHQVHGDWAYEAGGTGAGVALSRNGGMTWSQPREGLDRHYGWAVAADPAQPEVWYASVSPSAWKAHGSQSAQACIVRKVGGAPWERLAGGLPQPLDAMPYALLTTPAAPGHVYAALGNGDAWASDDHGDTWTQLPVTLADMHRTINRLMYGERDDPYAVLARLGSRLEATLSPEAVLPAIVETVAQALKLPYAAIALQQGDEAPIVASYGRPRGEPTSVSLVYQGSRPVECVCRKGR